MATAEGPTPQPESGDGGTSQQELLVLICTYNERSNLPPLFEQIHAVVPAANILVVDDASPDGTGEWVRERSQSDPRVHLMARSGKLGLGTAIREGMEYAIEHGHTWLINLDGDLSHDPKAMLPMLRQRDAWDLVIGSRYVEGGGLEGCSWRRILVSRCANGLARIMVGWSIQDCSSAYRMYRVASLKEIALGDIRATGYGFLEEVLAMLIRSGARVTETPITYTERQQGQSKISLKEAWSTFTALLHIARTHRRTLK
jgi:dolichol-phosphate mannosyltransferase